MSRQKTSPSGSDAAPDPIESGPTKLEIFLTFLYLGCTSFGGPVAHIGYFRDLLVERKKWLDGRAYADLVALCQFLPGPSSSQVGFGIGMMKGGYTGGLAAFAGFTLPSALIMLAFGIGLGHVGEATPTALLVGLKLVAVSVVGHAVIMMGRGLAPDWPRRIFAFAAGATVLAVAQPMMTLAVIAGGAVAGLTLDAEAGTPAADTPRPRRASLIWIILALGLLIILPLAVRISSGPLLDLADGFYRSGMLVFGGGHVVLPLLKAAVVEPGLVSDTVFLAGYGAAQAIPGPLFTIAAFLGQATGIGPYGIIGAAVALVMIFLGSFLLMLGVLPWWEKLRCQQRIRQMLDGVNAAVVGLLAAVLINPIMISAVTSPAEAVIALAGFFILLRGWLPPLAVVGMIVAATMIVAAVVPGAVAGLDISSASP